MTILVTCAMLNDTLANLVAAAVEAVVGRWMNRWKVWGVYSEGLLSLSEEMTGESEFTIEHDDDSRYSRPGSFYETHHTRKFMQLWLRSESSVGKLALCLGPVPEGYDADKVLKGVAEAFLPDWEKTPELIKEIFFECVRGPASSVEATAKARLGQGIQKKRAELKAAYDRLMPPIRGLVREAIQAKTAGMDKRGKKLYDSIASELCSGEITGERFASACSLLRESGALGEVQNKDEVLKTLEDREELLALIKLEKTIAYKVCD